MVIFLDKSYLDDAVLQRRNILSQYLLTVPTHVDKFEPFPHKGQVEDVKYRYLWKKFNTDVEFLQDASLRLNTEVGKLTCSLQDKIFYEPFESEKCPNTSLTEGINFNLCDDVIPSSNPGSPDLFMPIDDNESYSVLHDNFKKEDLQMMSVSNDCLKIEARLCTETLPNQVPQLSKLISRLTPMVATDPLINKEGQAMKEIDIFRDSRLMLSDKSELIETMLNIDLHGIEEGVEKESITDFSKRNELEETITGTIELQKKEQVYHALTTLLGTNLKAFDPYPIAKDLPLKEYLSNKVVKEEKDVSLYTMSYADRQSDVEEITFLDINEPIVTEIDRLCEEAILDTPLCSSPDYDPDLELPHCEPLQLTPYTPKLLDQEKKITLNKRCFSPELYCNEIQAYRLAEPYNFEAEREFRIPEKHVEKIKVITNIGKQSTATEDLQLSWDVFKITDLGNDPTHAFEKLETENSCVSDITETFAKSKLNDFVDLLLSEEKGTESFEAVEQITIEGGTINFDNILTHERIDEGNVLPELSPDDLEDGRVSEIHNQFKRHQTIANGNITDRPTNLSNPVINKINTAKGPTTTEFDPLGDFMALRLKKKETIGRKNECNGPKSSDQLKDLPFQKDESNALPIQKESNPDESVGVKQVAMKIKKTKHHVVNVRLSDSYEELVLILEKAALKYLDLLKTSNDITRSCSFQTLSPDITRFLIKQREKYQLDNNLKGTEDTTYRHLVCVHGLVGAADIVIKCCLESAIVFLNSIQDKYKDFIQDSLANVHQKLFRSKAELSHQQIFHPKMSALCKEVEVWLKKKRAKSGDNEQKILVIVKQNMPSLMNSLKKVLGLSKWLQPYVAESIESHELIESLDAHNCLILHANQIQDHFPWAQFSLVVEYEFQDNSEWKGYCERQNIRHMSLIIEHQAKQDTNSDGIWTSENRDKLISLVASQHVTANSSLLQLLEAKFNIQLYERDYRLLHGCSWSFSDLDIDENTAIIMENISGLKEDTMLHKIVTRIIALSLKYTSCFCLFYSDDRTAATGYQFPSHMIVNLNRLHTAMLNFGTRSKAAYRTKILVCPDVHELAATIRRISEETLISDTGGSTEPWMDRSWLTTDFTLEEKFLLQSPCLSSFNSQLMVKSIGISGCVKYSVDQLCKALPGMARTTLSRFHENLHQQHHIKAWEEQASADHSTYCDRDQVLNTTGGNLPSDASSLHPASMLGQQHEEHSSDQVRSTRKARSLPGIGLEQKTIPLKQNDQGDNANVDTKANRDLYMKSMTSQIETSDSTTSSTKKIRRNQNEVTPLQKSNPKKVYDNLRRISGEDDVHDQPMVSRQTPVRKLDFGSRSLTKPEECFRKFYGPKGDNGSRTPHKKHTHYNKSNNSSTDGASLQLERQRYTHTDHLNLQQTETDQLSKDQINLYQYRSDQTGMGKVNTQQHTSNLIPAEKLSLQQYSPDPERIDLQQNQHDNAHMDNLMRSRPDKALTNQYNLPQFSNDKFAADGMHSRQNRPDHALYDERNLQKYRPAYILTDEASLLDNNTTADQVNLQQYNTNQGSTATVNQQHNNSNDELQQYRWDQLPTSNTNIQYYGGEYIQTASDLKNIKQGQKSSDENDTNHGLYQNVIGESFETFDYNHGLPPLTGNNEGGSMDDSTLTRKDLQRKLMASLIVQEYPPANEVEKLHYAECDRIDSNHLGEFNNPDEFNVSFLEDTSRPNDKTDNHQKLFHDIEKESQVVAGQFNGNQAEYVGYQEHIPSLSFVADKVNNSILESYYANTCTPHSSARSDCRRVTFEKQEQNERSSQAYKEINLEQPAKNSKEAYVNPQLERISLRPNCSSYINNINHSDKRNFEDDLREATRRFLQNSEELPRLVPNTYRTPIQKRTIGLAQPLKRDKSVEETQQWGEGIAKWSMEERIKMQQSPWATADSPPIDLDYGDSPVNIPLHAGAYQAEMTNRIISKGQTPQKKMKLTYQKIPGKKGQTRLVFQ